MSAISVSVPITQLIGASIGIIKSIVMKWNERRKTRCILVPTEDIGKLIIEFLSSTESLIFDLDKIQDYVEWRDEDFSKYIGNKVMKKKLIKKFKRYVISEFGDVKHIVYITTDIDVASYFPSCCRVVLTPSPVYNSINKVPLNEVYNIKTTTMKAKYKYIFERNEEILSRVRKSLKLR